MVLPNTDQRRNYTLDGLGNWRATGFMPVDSAAQVDRRNNHYVNQITRRSVADRAAITFEYDNNTSPLHSRLYFTQDADWNTTAVIGHDAANDHFRHRQVRVIAEVAMVDLDFNQRPITGTVYCRRRRPFWLMLPYDPRLP
ncbi:MAG: hypothetical protein ACP5O1_12110 [Phycisphaerae bacterium]